MTSLLTRRDFLATGAVLAGGLALGVRPLRASSLRRSDTAIDLLPAPLEPSILASLATHAIDAARTAGATYADVRVGQVQEMFLGLSLQSGTLPGIRLETSLSYGVRVYVDGMWGFVHGTTPTPDAITRAARNAVARAKGYARINKSPLERLPMPAATGQWTTPTEIVPFTVPILDQVDRLGALNGALARVREVAPFMTGSNITWTQESRVFASSDGAQISQLLIRGQPDVHVLTLNGVYRKLCSLAPRSGGFEMLLAPSLEEDVKVFVEEAFRLGTYPTRPVDVGRYPLVLDGETMASFIGTTMAPALELDRVLRYQVDSVGTSVLAPPEDMLGTMIASPLMHIATDRAMPGFTAVQWDDDGAVPLATTLVDKGRLVDYLTTQTTAPALAAWYKGRGQPVRSNGSAVASIPSRAPIVTSTQTRMAPGTNRATLDDLVRDLRRGVLVMSSRVSTDYGLTGGQIRSNEGLMFWVEQGRIAHRIDGSAIQFRNTSLWKSMEALGDTTTLTTVPLTSFKDLPTQEMITIATAPAARFPSVDLIMLTGRR